MVTVLYCGANPFSGGDTTGQSFFACLLEIETVIENLEIVILYSVRYITPIKKLNKVQIMSSIGLFRLSAVMAWNDILILVQKLQFLFTGYLEKQNHGLAPSICNLD